MQLIRYLLLKIFIEIVEDYGSKGYTVYLEGKEDEIYQILKKIIYDKNLYQVKWLSNTSKLKKTNEKTVVVVWNSENKKIYKKLGIEYINLLNKANCL